VVGLSLLPPQENCRLPAVRLKFFRVSAARSPPPCFLFSPALLCSAYRHSGYLIYIFPAFQRTLGRPCQSSPPGELSISFATPHRRYFLSDPLPNPFCCSPSLLFIPTEKLPPFSLSFPLFYALWHMKSTVPAFFGKAVPGLPFPSPFAWGSLHLATLKPLFLFFSLHRFSVQPISPVFTVSPVHWLVCQAFPFLLPSSCGPLHLLNLEWQCQARRSLFLHGVRVLVDH